MTFILFCVKEYVLTDAQKIYIKIKLIYNQGTINKEYRNDRYN